MPVVRDERLGPLPDDVAPETHPRPARQLESDAGRLGDRGRQTATEPRRIEDQQQDLRAPRERRQPMQPVTDPRWRVGPSQSTAGQVEDQQVDRAAGEQAAGDAQTLVEAGRRDDDEPVEIDPARDGLHRVEAP